MPSRSYSVDDIYSKIFLKDPLLLKPGNQRKYITALVDHLLVYRSGESATPDPVDFREEWLKYTTVRPQRDPAKPPGKTLQKRYEQKRKLRKSLSKRDSAALWPITMTSDGGLTRRRTDGTYTRHDDAIEVLGPKIDGRLRIATVGYRVKVSKIEGKGYFGEELCVLARVTDTSLPELRETIGVAELGRTQLLDEATRVLWEEAVVAHIDKALLRKSHVVMLPEFALPSCSEDAPPIENKIEQHCRKRGRIDHFLFAGSRHEGGYNRGLMFSKQGGKVSGPYWHYKVASARGLHENILGPYRSTIESYLTRFKVAGREVYFAITVAICYDAFDPTMLLKLINQAISGKHNYIQKIILVPSFNPSADFVALLRDLSFLGRCTVVYVDGLHGTAKMFVSGVAVTDLVGKITEVREQLDREAQRIARVIAKIPSGYRIAKAKKQSVRTNELDSMVKALKTNKTLLDSLRNDLTKLEGDKAFDELITIEKSGSPDVRLGNGYFQASDILYYNIDVGIIGCLQDFSRGYLGNHPLLPRVFRDKHSAERRKMMKRSRQPRSPAKREAI
jgi:hypothetical protein